MTICLALWLLCGGGWGAEAWLDVWQARAWGQNPQSVLPEISRDELIQTPQQFHGFPIGSRHWRHDQVVSYFRHLEERSPRAKWISYGQTHGQRPLFVLAISSAENIEQLDRLRQRRRSLTNGLGRQVPDSAGLVMWMGYCVHGDEASAVNAAPLVAYHLVSGQSPEVESALNECVFLVDPAMNPDGVDRFANWVNENRGRFASEHPADREHSQSWPGGRSNYYWFDLNRDWLPLVHPESQGRLRLFHQWKPNVVLDYHEMGGSSTYFFQPGIPERNNPLIPPENLRLTRLFAERFAEVMDAAGELFFSEESFDDFYVGKGSTYPDLNGAVGILFEQGSTRGLRMKTSALERDFSQTISNQVRTSLSSIDTAIELKRPLLEFQHKFYREALQAGQADATTAYLLSGSPSRIRAALDLLSRHAIRGQINRRSLRLEGREHAAGDVLILPTAQPQFTMLRSLMETRQEFRENIFYDVSAWHLPSAFDLDMHRWQADIPSEWTESDGKTANIGADQQEWWADPDLLGLAFSPVELQAPRVVAQLMQADVELRVSLIPFATGEAAEVELPAGTVLVLKALNQRRWRSTVSAIRRLERQSSVRMVPLTRGQNPAGPDLGSGRLVPLPKCQPALIVGPGTSSTVAGALWHFLDQRMEQPAVLIDADRLQRVGLDDFSCVLLPAGSYAGWGAGEAGHLTEYARRGGTIIAIGGAALWLQRNGVVSGAATVARSSGGGDAIEPSQGPDAVEPLRFAEARDAAALESIAGAFFMTRIDSTHPLGFGFPDPSVPVFRDSTTAYATPANHLQVAAAYEGVIAGYVSQRNRQRLAGSPAVWAENLGRGRVIFLADNPVFRGYVRSSERFLTNALLWGPVLNIPSAPRDE